MAQIFPLISLQNSEIGKCLTSIPHGFLQDLHELA
jgi:hypothetical protein